jgi:hypothetical protein
MINKWVRCVVRCRVVRCGAVCYGLFSWLLGCLVCGLLGSWFLGAYVCVSFNEFALLHTPHHSLSLASPSTSTPHSNRGHKQHI